jgi:hypothetical protein
MAAGFPQINQMVRDCAPMDRGQALRREMTGIGVRGYDQGRELSAEWGMGNVEWGM